MGPYRRSVLSIIVMAVAAPAASGACTRTADGAIRMEKLRVKVVKSYAHDRDAFTQGLEWYRGRLYESTGLYSHSGLRRVVPDTGVVEQQHALPAEIFGEGITRVGPSSIVQLSWQNHRAFVWDLATLAPVQEFKYEGEGWGVCFDGERLVMSDGSDRLTFRAAATFDKQGEIRVRKEGQPLANLNELECVGGVVYANVWQTDFIARIDAKTGTVTGWIDAAGLLQPAERRATDVLNGIAFVRETGRFFVTGKNWPKLFEVEFVPAP